MKEYKVSPKEIQYSFIGGMITGRDGCSRKSLSQNKQTKNQWTEKTNCLYLYYQERSENWGEII